MLLFFHLIPVFPTNIKFCKNGDICLFSFLINHNLRLMFVTYCVSSKYIINANR